jgi:hypothetical protein
LLQAQLPLLPGCPGSAPSLEVRGIRGQYQAVGRNVTSSSSKAKEMEGFVYVVCCTTQRKQSNPISGQNNNIKVGNKYFENVAKLTKFLNTLAHQSYIHEEIKSRLNSESV